MPDETTQQKAERQARLSRAMGVMFLQDKVDKLEQDVSKITYPRGMHKTGSAPASNTRHHGAAAHAAAAQVRAQPRAVTGPGLTPASDAATTDRDSNEPAKKATSIRLVDASVLIFSLRSVHNWSRDQSTCVVIPLEAINTLDLLKKGDEPINLAARKATRWLEDKIAVSTQDRDAMLTEPAPGIFAQKEHFRVASTQIAEARQTRLDQLQSDATGDGEAHAGAADLDHDPAPTQPKGRFNASEAPRYLRELLSVCLYCHQTAAAASNFAVAVAYPPHHVQEAILEEQLAASDKPSYLNRTGGRVTEAWLHAYGIPYEVVPTSKTWTGEKPSSRFRGEIAGVHHPVGSSEDLVGALHSGKGQQQRRRRRRRASPTPSVSSSTSSFRSELSGLSMLGTHRSPRLRQESRFSATTAPLRSVRGISTSAAAANAATDAASLTGNEASEAQHNDSTDEDGPIIARPSSTASSHTSFVSSLTASTQDEWSSQTSASFSSHCGTRIVRHAPSPSPSGPTTTSAMDSGGAAAFPMSSTPGPMTGSDRGVASPRLTSRTLHKTKSGAEKMEEYLRRLEAAASAAAAGGARTATATPTPGAMNRSG